RKNASAELFRQLKGATGGLDDRRVDEPTVRECESSGAVCLSGRRCCDDLAGPTNLVVGRGECRFDRGKLFGMQRAAPEHAEGFSAGTGPREPGKVVEVGVNRHG